MIRRGQIYWVQLDPAVEAEIKKTRPALVVSNNQSNDFSTLITVLPITSNAKLFGPFEVAIQAGEGGVKADGKIKANQIRTIDKKRLMGEALGPLVSPSTMNQVAQALKIHLSI